MKKFLLTIFSVLLVVILAGCGVYTPPITTPSEGSGGSTQKPGPDDDNPPSVVEGDAFTVTLISGGKRYYPETEMSARWANDEEIFEAPFSSMGVATAYGLDGEYTVTLSNLPQSYTYYSHSADSGHRNTIIELFSVKTTVGGSTKGSPASVSTGLWRVTIESENQVKYFRFTPTQVGNYVVESKCDVVVDEVNPLMSTYLISNYAETPVKTYGTCGKYTKNFRYLYDGIIDASYIGNSLYFTISATQINNKFPVTVEFNIDFETPVEHEGGNYEIVEAHGRFLNLLPEGNWRYKYADSGNVMSSSNLRLNWIDKNNNGIYDEAEEFADANGNGVYDRGERFEDANGNGVYDQGDGGDGFYHLYDEELYKSTGGYGPVLFAMLDMSCEILNYEIYENVRNGGAITGRGIDKRIKSSGKDYTDFLDAYTDYINDDGAHPVNPEMITFLKDLAYSLDLFCDGDGVAEINGFNSAEDDIWLFCCGYYYL